MTQEWVLSSRAKIAHAIIDARSVSNVKAVDKWKRRHAALFDMRPCIQAAGSSSVDSSFGSINDGSAGEGAAMRRLYVRRT